MMGAEDYVFSASIRNFLAWERSSWQVMMEYLKQSYEASKNQVKELSARLPTTDPNITKRGKPNSWQPIFWSPLCVSFVSDLDNGLRLHRSGHKEIKRCPHIPSPKLISIISIY